MQTNPQSPAGAESEKLLSGSQAKTAFALRQNIERMLAGDSPLELVAWQDAAGVERETWAAKDPQNLNCAAFLTLTVGDEWTRAEALAARRAADQALQAAQVKAARVALFVRVCHCLGHRPKTKKGAAVDLRALERKAAGRLTVAQRRQVEASRVAALVPDDGERHFVQVWDAAEASRRINNLNRRLLPDLFERAVIVTERHKNRAIHFHLIGILQGRPDIRTSFDFAAFKAARKAREAGTINATAESRYKLAAAPALVRAWALLREKLPGYGFGRAELTPIEKTGEAVACYVSKYVEKNISQRIEEDKRKKLVRYLGDWGRVVEIQRPDRFAQRVEWIEACQREKQPICLFGLPPAGCWKLRANDFSWAGQRAWAWWSKAGELAGLIGWEKTSKLRVEIGPRWAWKLSGIWREHVGDNKNPELGGDREARRAMVFDVIEAQRAFWAAVKCGLSNLKMDWGLADIKAGDYSPAEGVDYWDRAEWDNLAREMAEWDAGREKRLEIRADLIKKRVFPHKHGVSCLNYDDIYGGKTYDKRKNSVGQPAVVHSV